MNKPEKLSLALLPTPMQKLERLTKHIGGPEIYVKRDDLTGIALSGNKVRKLEFSLAEAVRGKAATVITTGGIQSNHCRATATAAAQLGLKSHLVLRGNKPEYPQGNVLLDHVAGARIKWITPEEYRERDRIMAELAGALEENGEKCYIIPEGASNEVGAWGYFAAAEEIAAQCRERGLHFDAIYHAIGSGGTTAGLALGLAASGLKTPVKSVSVGGDADYFMKKVGDIAKRLAERYGFTGPAALENLEIVEGYIGPGYAIPYPEVIETIKHVARLEGLFLDPVYTGKAMYGMITEVKKGRWKNSDKLLFIHTGGIFDLFAYNEHFGWE